MAEERISDPARRLNTQHKYRVCTGKLMDHLPEGLALRQLVHLRNRVDFQGKRVLNAVRQRLLLLPRVKTLVHAPGLIRVAQAFFGIVQIAVAQLAQEAPDGDPAGPGNQRHAFCRFKGDLRGVRQHPACHPLFAWRELTEGRFDTAQHFRLCRHTASLLTGCQLPIFCYLINNAGRVPCSQSG